MIVEQGHDQEQEQEQGGTPEGTYVKKFPLMELFGPTIQGEGPVIGHRTLFLRFGVCDYRCGMCDSLHAVIPELIKLHADYLTLAEIFELVMIRAQETACYNVTISGGNPLVHDLTGLVVSLKAVGFVINVETQGTIFRPWVTLCDNVVISPKSPGMKEKFELEKFDSFLSNVVHLKNVSVKIVIFSMVDIEFALSVFDMLDGYLHVGGYLHIGRYISLGNPMPPNEENAPAEFHRDKEFTHKELMRHYRILMEDILKDRRLGNVIVLPQLHVVLWGNARGV